VPEPPVYLLGSGLQYIVRGQVGYVLDDDEIPIVVSGLVSVTARSRCRYLTAIGWSTAGAESGEDVIRYLQRISLPAAGAHEGQRTVRTIESDSASQE
jgi:hypothetical protein